MDHGPLMMDDLYLHEVQMWLGVYRQNISPSIPNIIELSDVLRCQMPCQDQSLWRSGPDRANPSMPGGSPGALQSGLACNVVSRRPSNSGPRSLYKTRLAKAESSPNSKATLRASASSPRSDHSSLNKRGR